MLIPKRICMTNQIVTSEIRKLRKIVIFFNFTSILFDYLLISWVTNCIFTRGLLIVSKNFATWQFCNFYCEIIYQRWNLVTNLRSNLSTIISLIVSPDYSDFLSSEQKRLLEISIFILTSLIFVLDFLFK